MCKNIEPSALGAVICTLANRNHACSPGAFMPEALNAEDTPEEARERARAAADEEIPLFMKESTKLGSKGAMWLLYIISAYVRSIITEEERGKAASDFDKLSPEVQKFLNELEI